MYQSDMFGEGWPTLKEALDNLPDDVLSLPIKGMVLLVVEEVGGENKVGRISLGLDACGSQAVCQEAIAQWSQGDE